MTGQPHFARNRPLTAQAAAVIFVKSIAAIDLTKMNGCWVSTISDVARRTCVSPAAVSRHASGTEVCGGERTEAAIKELNYRPNQLARGLRSRQRGCVGVIVPGITNPLSELLRARLATPDREQQHLTLAVELVVRGSTSAPALKRSARRSSRMPERAQAVDRGPATLLKHTGISEESS